MVTEAAKKPHISPSAIDTYNKCPEMWRRRYIEKDIIPPGIAMLRGTGVHKGAEENFRQKIESKKDLPRKEIIDHAVAGYESKIKLEGVELKADEKAAGKKIAIGKGKDSVVSLAGLLADEVAPGIQPASVEEEIRIVMDDCDRDLLGYLDLTTVDKTIDELKTSSKSQWKSKAGTTTQFIMYSLMHLAKHGELPADFRIHELVNTKKPKYNFIDGIHFGQADFEPLVRRINATLKGISAGFFPPATPGAWWCSKNFCGYWDTCPYVNSERKAAAAAPDKKKTNVGILDKTPGIVHFMRKGKKAK